MVEFKSFENTGKVKPFTSKNIRDTVLYSVKKKIFSKTKICLKKG